MEGAQLDPHFTSLAIYSLLDIIAQLEAINIHGFIHPFSLKHKWLLG